MCQPRGEDSGQMHRRIDMEFKRVVMNSIHCYSIRLLSQGNSEGIYRMAAKTFDTVCFCTQEGNWGSEAEGGEGQARKEEGGIGSSRPSLKVQFCTVSASGSWHSREVAVRNEQRSRPVVMLHRGSVTSPVNDFEIHNLEVGRGAIVALYNLQVATEHPSHPMAPRLRATPRRGRNYGQRGSLRGRGSQSPRRISPLLCASPPSIGSEDSGYAISNTVQSAKFKFRRRTNKPIVSALVTVIFSEEEEEEGSLKEETEEQTPSPSNNSSQRRGMEDSSYIPSSQSRLEDDSTFAHSEEQAEVLQEIGSMKDKDIMNIAQQTTEVPQAMDVTKKASPQKQALDKEPDNSFANILYLKLPPGMTPEDIPDGMEVTWERDPDKEAEQCSKNLK